MVEEGCGDISPKKLHNGWLMFIEANKEMFVEAQVSVLDDFIYWQELRDDKYDIDWLRANAHREEVIEGNINNPADRAKLVKFLKENFK